jgi:hypothetical protein
MTETNFDFNQVDPQRSFEVIPENTIVELVLKIHPGGAGDDGWLKRAANGKSVGLNCECTVTNGEYVKKKVWLTLTLRGDEPGHAEAGEISMRTLRAILESAKGIRPDNNSEAAQNARKPASWADFDGLRFFARVGVRPPEKGYPAKNTIIEVITPDKQGWRQPEQIGAKTSGTVAPAAPSAPAATPPANAIKRPEWMRS